MTKAEMEKVMSALFSECQLTREAGQKEYAQEEKNAFANFERTGREINLERKKVWYIFARKHWDGITAAINGHVSQREPVRGRIKDLIVYLCLLEGMFQEEESHSYEFGGNATSKVPTYPPSERVYRIENQNDRKGE